MSKSGFVGFIAGAVTGAALGMVAGILMAPRAGAETRSMVGEAATDAWGNVIDAYKQGTEQVAENVDLKSDELREKVDQARARMDQIRSSLSENVSQMADKMNSAVQGAKEGVEAEGAAVSEATPAGTPSSATPATGVAF